MYNSFWKRFYKEFETEIGIGVFAVFIAVIIGIGYIISIFYGADLIDNIVWTLFGGFIIFLGAFVLFGIVFLVMDFKLHIKTLRKYNEKLPHTADEIQNMNFDNFMDFTQYMHDISTYASKIGPIESKSLHLKMDREEVVKVLDIAMIAFTKEKEEIVVYKEMLLDIIDRYERNPIKEKDPCWFIFKYN